jgi:hypothetical protein
VELLVIVEFQDIVGFLEYQDILEYLGIVG